LDYLACCIASVADQKGVSVEHIVQDGGSDGFSEFTQRMEAQWPERPGYRRVMISESDQGMYDAVNRGMKKAGGSVLAYLNCDEQYLPGALARVWARFLAVPAMEVLFGGVLVVGPDGILISARKPARLSLPHIMTCHLPNFTCAMFFRKSLLQGPNAFFDAQWRDCADALWVIDRLRAKTKLGRIPEFTTAFTDTGANMNLSPNGLREAREIRQGAPRLWRWSKPLWVLLHWLGKLWDGSYWPSCVAYELYGLKSFDQRIPFFRQSANPFWVQRWFIRERIRWKNRHPARA